MADKAPDTLSVEKHPKNHSVDRGTLPTRLPIRFAAGRWNRFKGLLTMNLKTIVLAVSLSASPAILHAQFDFKVDGKNVQVHSFGSQGFMYSSGNNYMTMKTTSGSFAFTDVGANVSTQLTDKFRVGAQIYDRNVGQLGNWQPTLDWAVADYKFKDWFGMRAGKVKSTLGLFNDSQDAEFLHTWAIMPQSVYSLDQRGSMISHYGADVYGSIGSKKMGGLSYTVYGGKKPQDLTGGFVYAIETSTKLGNNADNLPILVPAKPVDVRKVDSYGGTVYGADVRWNTPVNGLLVGSSYAIQTSTAHGIYPVTGKLFYFETVKDNTAAFYTEYTVGNLRFDGEYRRELAPTRITTANGVLGAPNYRDVRLGYVAASYRLTKLLEVGSYHSRFISKWDVLHSDPLNHVFDTALTARVDLRSYLDLKIEGHFIDGYMASTTVSRGFYVAPNPQGLKPDTHLFVVRLGFHM